MGLRPAPPRPASPAPTVPRPDRPPSHPHARSSACPSGPRPVGVASPFPRCFPRADACPQTRGANRAGPPPRAEEPTTPGAGRGTRAAVSRGPAGSGSILWGECRSRRDGPTIGRTQAPSRGPDWTRHHRPGAPGSVVLSDGPPPLRPTNPAFPGWALRSSTGKAYPRRTVYGPPALSSSPDPLRSLTHTRTRPSPSLRPCIRCRPSPRTDPVLRTSVPPRLLPTSPLSARTLTP